MDRLARVLHSKCKRHQNKQRDVWSIKLMRGERSPYLCQDDFH